jgi:dolichol-phosphate mannosyltransferase
MSAHRYDFSLSVVIPVYNDEEVLGELRARLTGELSRLTAQWEVVFVDDGSRDRSPELLSAMAAEDPRIRFVRLVRNFGQFNAIAAGFDQAAGDVIVLMDSDLQDKPEDIEKLLDRLVETGAPMVIVRWASRRDSFAKVTASRVFQWVTRKITSVHHTPGLGVFRVIRRELIETLDRFPERTATGISLLYWAGYPYEIVDLERDARFAGSSGYTIGKMLRLTFDRIFSYSLFPIRLASVIGLAASLLSVCFAVYFAAQRFLFDNILPGWTSLISVILLLFGINFVFLGVIGEYLGRVFMETKRRPKYIIAEICEKGGR